MSLAFKYSSNDEYTNKSNILVIAKNVQDTSATSDTSNFGLLKQVITLQTFDTQEYYFISFNCTCQ
jgi:hypothetical protein